MKHWNAEYYDKNSTMQFRTAMEMLNRLSLQGNERILDVGCGNGRITAELAKRTKNEVVGLDLSSEMIQFAKQHYIRKNLAFCVGDVTDMRFNKEFDVIISFWTLSWVADQYQALQNIINSLKDGGRILLMYPMRHDIYNIVDKVIKRPAWIEYFPDFKSRPFISEESYREILQKLNIPLECRKKQICCEFNSYQEMEDSVRSWLAHIDKISSPRKKSIFLMDVIEEYLTSTGKNTPLMYFNVLEITGKKVQKF